MSQHTTTINNKEAVGCSEVPGPADPVTVAGDLGGLAPCAPAREQGPRRRVRSRTSEAPPAASGAASSSRPPARRRRRWRAGVLRAALLRPVTLLDALPPVAEVLLHVLPLPGQARVCLTSRTVRATLLPRVRLWGGHSWDAVRRGVKDLVRMDGPMNAALTASGVRLRLGDVFRVLAVAWDVVDSYGHRPLPAEVPLVALALARYGMKTFLLTTVQLDSLAKHMRAGGCMHLPRVEDAVESPDPPESW